MHCRRTGGLARSVRARGQRISSSECRGCYSAFEFFLGKKTTEEVITSSQ